ncbi:MAG: PQQ-binding-like beta-propeller repeat protein [Acidimicrobiales bacterium]
MRSTSAGRRARPSLRAGFAGISLLLLTTGAALALSGGGTAGAAASAPHVDATTSWTVYHGDPLGTGVDTSGVTFSPPNLAWKSPALDGQVFGEPIEATGRVFVATESDTIYALAANTGAVLWSTHVGNPVPSGTTQYLPCGDIQPTVGITGTPVVDPSRGEIFAVADELVNGAPAHYLVGLNIYTGASELDQAVDPPDSSVNPPGNLLQRTGLNLDGGNVVFGFGGNSGDCEPYHGWIVSVPEGGGGVGYYDTTGSVSNGTQGAVWQGGAGPEVDAGGNIWAATGNGSGSSPYDGSDSVIELSQALALKQFFAPSDWQTDNQQDRDLGSGVPALLSNGTVFQAGKSQRGFLLNQASLGGVNPGVTTISLCGGAEVDGGNAVQDTTVYIPCQGGVEAVQTSPSPSVLWTAPNDIGAPPILAGGLVWSISGSTLYGLDPTTGTPVQQVSVGGEANHFPTPSVGDGLLLAPSTDQVYAFSGSAGLPGPPSPPPPAPGNSSYWLVASDGGNFNFGNAGFHG